MRVLPYNANKPHRCPACNAITDEDKKCKWAVVTCCHCGVMFTRFYKLAAYLPKLGVVCVEHTCKHKGSYDAALQEFILTGSFPMVVRCGKCGSLVYEEEWR